MRLINADAMPCDICDFQKCPCFNPLCCRDFSMWFKATAYDVEKVCEELEKYRKLCFLTMANTGDEQLDNVYDYVSSAIEEAIDIVKRGGVDD